VQSVAVKKLKPKHSTEFQVPRTNDFRSTSKEWMIFSDTEACIFLCLSTVVEEVTWSVQQMALMKKYRSSINI
jgi:hypothetical protein